MNKKHELIHFFKDLSNNLSSEYDRISSRAKEDPGTAGDEGEESWKCLLQNWLPENYRVVTKGRLLSSSGEASPQVDIIILKPSYPPFLLGKKYYLIDGVAAAFECKTTLRARDLDKVFKTAAIISKLCRKKTGNPCVEILPPVSYGILAHSHAWKGEDEAVVDIITKKIKELAVKNAVHPRELPECICIANLAGWTTGHSINMSFPINNEQVPDREKRKEIFSYLKQKHANFKSFELYQDSGLDVLYVNRPYSTYFTQFVNKNAKNNGVNDSFTPVGAFVYALYKKLAYRDPGLEDISQYFTDVHIPGGSGGLGPADALHWERDVFSQSVWDKLDGGYLVNTPEWRTMYF
ncbi:TPA: hypothetical protein QHU55_002577 [Klebsiella aerogenes]|uniref:DUF6602 domain-containing protein n=1 Tax=Klebsiella aerogenes TaxID=548 RepID=UPI00275B6585|nr:hypothetical protein [Klebsiella aerogenes]HDS6533885.1 hypothetical protein [Klebsiella aerogenes]HDS7500280.1 hypothetical protein [Klebsiella aerogenes]HDS9641937.1 hypothetical protein [Klebsiella aerogenes]HDT0787976.1 hypothetical protein [Klebsiella aerogenes]